MQYIKPYLLLLVAVAFSALSSTSAFVTPGSNVHLKSISSQSQSNSQSTNKFFTNFHENVKFPQAQAQSSSSSTTSLQMGYNLPPGGSGGSGGPGDKIMEFITPVLTIGAVVLFFMSPLGGIFFAITNSLFILALITPIVIGVGFNVWQSLYTIEGACPNCGSPARVLKDEEAGPNVCLACGQLIRATVDKDGIELCNNPNDIFDEKSRVSSFFDIFTSDRSVYEETTTTTTVVDAAQKRKDQTRREQTIIDIDVDKD
jgi:hypothetical protein